jgi:hypothetical protein
MSVGVGNLEAFEFLYKSVLTRRFGKSLRLDEWGKHDLLLWCAFFALLFWKIDGSGTNNNFARVAKWQWPQGLHLERYMSREIMRLLKQIYDHAAKQTNPFGQRISDQGRTPTLWSMIAVFPRQVIQEFVYFFATLQQYASLAREDRRSNDRVS